jgi:hypothetical protein
LKLGINGDEGCILLQTLRYQQAIERVAMMQGKFFQRCQMGKLDRKNANPVLDELPLQVRC